jgi:hypothetical protein
VFLRLFLPKRAPDPSLSRTWLAVA